MPINAKLINVCKNCGENYCMECSETDDWENFCSEKCKDSDNKLDISITIEAGW